MTTYPDEPAVAVATCSAPRVVVADDVEEIRGLLELWLGEAGYEVVSAISGREVTELVRRQAVDLVVTDVLMPDGDGLEVITSLRRTATTTKVLAISGGGAHLRAADCLTFARGVGAHGVLTKPFNRAQLLGAGAKIAPLQP